MSLDFSVEGLRKIRFKKDENPLSLSGTYEAKHHSTKLMIDENVIKGYEIDLDKLPKHIKKIQFRMY